MTLDADAGAEDCAGVVTSGPVGAWAWDSKAAADANPAAIKR
jgi:hypothetical protein